MSSGNDLTEQFRGISMDEPSLKCTICKEYYTEPRILPCGHNFCTQCLVDLRNSGSETSNLCPECRRVFVTPVLQLPLNFTVKELAEGKKQQEEANIVTARQVPQAPVLFTVKILDLHGKTRRIHDIRAETSVNELKARFCEQTGIPTEEQRLIYAGKPLEEGKVMKDYNIGKDSTINLVLRVIGGIMGA